MKRIFFILFCLLFLGLSVHTYAQKNKAFRAYSAYEAGAYSDAIDLFKEAYDLVSDKTQKTDILFHVGECYRKISLPLKAALWYKKAIDKDYSDPIIHLNYGEMLLMNEKFEPAKDQFVKYKSLVPDDPRGEGQRSLRSRLERHGEGLAYLSLVGVPIDAWGRVCGSGRGYDRVRPAESTPAATVVEALLRHCAVGSIPLVDWQRDSGDFPSDTLRCEDEVDAPGLY